MADRDRRERAAADERGDPDADSPPAEPDSASAPPTPVTQQVGRVTIIVLAVLFGVFALDNAQFVDFSWIFGESQVVESGGQRVGGGVPLILLLLASFVLGAAVGGLLGWRRRRRRRREPADRVRR